MNELHPLHALFRPTCVAVVGASDQPGSVGQAVYTNLKRAGFGGRLIPVNRKHSVIDGDPAIPDLSQADPRPDLVVVCTPADTVPQLTRTCGELGVGGMIVISAGFRETGEQGRRLEAEVRDIKRQFPGLRIIGPNCLGVLVPHGHLNASFSGTMPRPGGLAVISQSGALCTAILDWSREREIGFSGVISVGNMLDVGFADVIDYFANDPATTALLLYIESLTNSQQFLTAARNCSRTKPIIALKSGRFEESSLAASSHTGAMVGVDAVYDAAFRGAGIERVYTFDDLFDCARLLERNREAPGPRLAIVTNAGGPGIMASDAWLALRGKMAHLSPQSIQSLNETLPSQWSHGNPVDVLGDARAERYVSALQIVADDPGVDSLIVILTPQSMTDPTGIAEALARMPRPAGKPLLAVWMGGPAVRPGRQRLEAAGIPVYVTPEQSVQALAHLVSAGRLRELSRLQPIVSPAPLDPPAVPCADSSRLNPERREKWQQLLAAHSGLLGEVQSKQLLADYGIPVVRTLTATTAAQAASVAEQVGFPVVLKILSPDISHKTDVGGVELNLAHPDAVVQAYQRMLTSVAIKAPGAKVEGVTVQRMIAEGRSIELLLGARHDPIFGPVIVVGSGGVTTEIQHDLSMQLPPLDQRLIDCMLQELRIYPLLNGYRGRPGVDLVQLREVILKFSRLIHEQPALSEIEINPLLTSQDAIIALDARILVTHK